jgi:aryl-alcohol dehydrogenase-like predicted oxidoreductase
MNYRRIGRAGIKVSELSLGSWVTYGNQMDTGAARECMAAAWDRGVNFFDNAEVYALGKSEEIMGEALKKLAWPRVRYVVSTKFFWGLNEGPNEKNTLNRKYLLQAMDASLKRLQLDYVDLVYCHRPIRTRRSRKRSGRCTTSSSRQGGVLGDLGVERRGDPRRVRGRRAPSPPQAHRGAARVQPLPSRPRSRGSTRRSIQCRPRAHDVEPARFGNPHRQVPQGRAGGSRGTITRLSFMAEKMKDARKRAAVDALEPIAADLGCTLAQLALAWCLKNPNVSTVITGASRVSQVEENLKAADVAPKLTPEVMARIEAATAGAREAA